jgi:exopolysaccharide biosynthesis polyprenyl glycosylphosphotransferase
MFRRKDVPVYTVTFTVLSDLLAMYIALFLAWLMRFKSGFIQFHDTPLIDSYILLATLWAIVLIIVFHFIGLYNIRVPLSFLTEAAKVTQGMFVSVAILFAMSFFLRTQLLFSRLTVSFMGIFALVWLLVLRKFVRIAWGKFLREHGFLQRVVLIGWTEKSAELVQHVRADINSGRNVVGILSDEKISNLPEGIQWLGKTGDLENVLKNNELDEIILGTLQVPHTEISNWILTCERNLVQFRLVPDLFEILASRVQLDFVSGVPLLGIGEFPLDRPINRVMKRCFDIFGSIIGLILSSPFIIAGAFLIRLESAGPLFYVQERCGRDGRPFRMYKLRTMRPDAEKETGPVWAKADDPRRTRIGTFLRQCNIDETPQFWNVLTGKMSLVGPRPERPFFVEQFKDEIRHYMPRHSSKPGMTGWAQVNGLRGNTPLDERIRYDLYYHENWSIWFDIRIMIATFLNFKNAY